jgi:MFS family permease/quinol monooxygenase YgiN
MSASPRSVWKPLSRPLFRGVWIASVASHVGSYMTDVGQGWLLSSLTPSPLVVSLLLTAESLPFFALGLPAGALADIIDRRRLLIVTQIAMAIVVGTLAIATLTGAVTPWMLLVLAFALGIATAFNDPAWHSVVPELLPSDELAAGVTLNAVGINVARSLGPALGGLVVATAGPGVVFVIDALSFVGVVAALFAWRREKTASVLPAERMLGAIRAGVRFARNSRALRRVLAGTFAFMICGAGVMALMPLLGRETGRGAVGFGLLLGSLGVGAVSGATLLPRVRSKLAPQWLIAAGFVVFAAVAAAASATRELAMLCPVMFVGGFAWIAVLSTLNVAAQQASPPWVRARALAVFLIVFQAAVAGGSVLWGAVATRAGLSDAYLCIAGALLAGAALALRIKPAADAIEDYTPAHHWPDPVVEGAPALDAGPIMVQVEYRVDSGCAEAFRGATAELGRSRRRDGAIQWWLFQDTADPSRFVETWIEETWAEHLRVHERVSVAHRELEQRVRDLTRAGSSIETRHFIAPTARGSASAHELAVEERTCR